MTVIKERHHNLMKRVKQETVFVKCSTGNIFLPRPAGWCGGWSRHIWFQRLTGMKPQIASPCYWKDLCEMYDVLRLIEYEDGNHEIINEAR